MIKVGDIVYRRRRGGFLHEYPDVVKSSVGLVIKELLDKGAVPQYYVDFDDKERRLWYLQHDLHKIGGERKKHV